MVTVLRKKNSVIENSKIRITHHCQVQEEKEKHTNLHLTVKDLMWLKLQDQNTHKLKKNHMEMMVSTVHVLGKVFKLILTEIQLLLIEVLTVEEGILLKNQNLSQDWALNVPVWGKEE